MLTRPDFKEKQILFVLSSYGEKISFKNDNIIVTDKNGKTKHQSTCYKLFVLFVVGHISITSGLLQRAGKFGFTIVLLSHSFRFLGIWQSKTEGNVLLRKKQYEYNELGIAKHLVVNKIINQTLTLRCIRGKGTTENAAIGLLQEQEKQLSSLLDINLKNLLGCEGICSREYFRALYLNLNWKGRKPRVKHDIANCILDIGYSMLFNIIDALLNSYGFDVYKGVYHTVFYQRKSLTCDLIEPFRPLIDMQVRKAFHLGMINPEDFSLINRQYRLFGEHSQKYVLYLLEPIIRNKEQIFLYVQSYYRSFIKDKEIKTYPVFKIREM